MRDTPIDRHISKSLSAEAQSPAGHVVDENRMAAYLEGNLSPEEAIAFEAHMANCDVCQETLALALKLQSQEDEPFQEQPSSPARKRLFHISIPISAVAGLLLCAGIAVVFFRVYDEPRRFTAPQVAELPPAARNEARPSVSTPPAVESEPAQKIASGPESKEKTREIQPRSAAPVQPAPPPVDGLFAVGASGDIASLDKKGALNMPAEAVGGSTAPVQPEGARRADAPMIHKEEMPTPVLQNSASPPAAAVSLGKITAPSVAIQAQNSKAKDEADASGSNLSAEVSAPARTQEPFQRPSIYAASNRIATTLYETESFESYIRFVIRSLDVTRKSAENKAIGDRVFFKNRGYWIDKQCAENSADPIVVIKAADSDFASIMQKYPDTKALLPAIIYWEKKNYVLSK